MSSGIGNLTTLIQRLEAAASRLEDIVIAQTGEPEKSEKSEAEPVAPAASSPALEAWAADVGPAVRAYEDASAAIGPLVREHAELVRRAMDEVQHVIEAATVCRKPEQDALPAFFEPLQAAVKSVVDFRDAHRGDTALFSHFSTVSEGVPALGWVAVEPTPGPYIGDMKDSAQFYANRIIKEYKGSDEAHVAWARSFIAVLDAMRTYVMAHHRTGLAWQAHGQDVSVYRKASASSASAPPAPPPAPPAPPAPAAPAPVPPSVGGMDAVFQDINQGEGITRSLRKVDRSEMTHKNPALRAPQAAPAAPAASASTAAPVASKRHAPHKALDGNKWAVEHFAHDAHIVVDGTDIGHTVHIFDCDHCVIHIRGKVNAVSMLSCTKTSVVIDSLVSSLEVTHCRSFAAQVMGYTPTVLIDSCDSGQVYLSEQGLQTDVITAKSSALNVSVPAASGEPGVLEEIALPEQLKHTLTRSGPRTVAYSEVVHHAG